MIAVASARLPCRGLVSERDRQLFGLSERGSVDLGIDGAETALMGQHLANGEITLAVCREFGPMIGDSIVEIESPWDAAWSIAIDATPFVVENTLTTVSVSQARSVLGSASPPHRSTTSWLSTTAEQAAPTSRPSAKFSSNTSRTRSKPAATVPKIAMSHFGRFNTRSPQKRRKAAEQLGPVPVRHGDRGLTPFGKKGSDHVTKTCRYRRFERWRGLTPIRAEIVAVPTVFAKSRRGV